ncbi:MAG: C4-dicarboxylate ABC transporter substrate-binding protein, partial [Thermodesulfobacteriota bacterium]
MTLLFVFSVQLSLAKSIEFNANVFYNEAVPMSGVGYGEWAKNLEKLSNGALKAKVFYGGVLAPPKASLTAVSDGLAEVGHIPAMYTPSDLPVSNLLHELSANFTDSLATMAALTEYNFTNKELQDQYKKWNLFFGGAYSTPEYRIFCKDKVTTLDEMKGKKIRTLGAGSALLVKQMGGIPVNVPSSEMYSGLEKGILDCAAN